MGRKKSSPETELRVCPACHEVIASQEKILPLGKTEIHRRCEGRIIYDARQKIYAELLLLPKKFCLTVWAEEMAKGIFQVRTIKALEEFLWKIGDDLLTILVSPCFKKIRAALRKMIEWLGQLSEKVFFWKPAWAM